MTAPFSISPTEIATPFERAARRSMSSVRATASPAGTTSGACETGPTGPTRSSSSGAASHRAWRSPTAASPGRSAPTGSGRSGTTWTLFPNARYFVVGYGTNDLGMWPEVERTSPRIIENLDGMVRAIREGGRGPILLNVPYANESVFPRHGRRGSAPHEPTKPFTEGIAILMSERMAGS